MNSVSKHYNCSFFEKFVYKTNFQSFSKANTFWVHIFFLHTNPWYADVFQPMAQDSVARAKTNWWRAMDQLEAIEGK